MKSERDVPATGRPRMSDPHKTTPFLADPSAAAPGQVTVATTLPGAASESTCPAGGERYRLLGELARGGMGIVYRATDTILDREVALKVLQERFTLHSSIGQRFVDEARITGQLQHPGIPAVHDLGNLPDGRPFLVMKLVKGRTLAELLSERPDLSVERGRWVAVFEQLCQAVGYAHAHKVIHRDLKPANVMVGSFGEVQVMDWGLAKLLTPPGAAPAAQPASQGDGSSTEIRTLRAPDDSATLTGSLMGTPAFMPPEQAGGETDKIDERADVFGLGAVLCVILTGQPPYAGRDTESVRLMAVRGQLGDCLARLDTCAAEPGLVQLCRRCLAFDPTDRPRDAGAVAQEVAALRAQAEERARQAELDRARTEVEAREHRKRRRVQLALVAAVLLVIGVIGGGWTWLSWQAQARRAEADRSATLALAKGEHLADQTKEVDSTTVPGAEAALGLWRQATAAGEQAEGVAATAGDEDLAAQVTRRAGVFRDGLARAESALARARRDASLLADLERARGRLVQTVQGKVDLAGTARAYREALQTAGLPAEAGADVLAEAIQKERPGVREALISALDQWAGCFSRGPEQDRVRLAADRADGDPLRRQIRAAVTSRDKEELVRLAQASAPTDLPPVTAVLLGTALWNRGQVRSAELLLRAARDHHPSDFGVLRELGGLLVNSTQADPVKVEEGIGCMRAALALRPESPVTHLEVGWVLTKKDDWAGAEACFRKALQLDPKFAMGYNNLGNALHNQKKLEEAEACCRKAIELDPQLALAHGSLGLVLKDKKDLEEASRCFRKAIEIDPNYARAHYNLASILRFSNEEEAIAHLRQAVQSSPSYALAHNSLGTIFFERGEMDSALACFQNAIQSSPNTAAYHSNLGNALRGKKDLPGAIASYRKAVQLAPNFLQAQRYLCYTLDETKDMEGVIVCCRKIIQLDPRDAIAHNYLGKALSARRDLPGAIASYRKAIAIAPNFASAHTGLGNALRARKDVEGAMASYRLAIESEPAYAPAHVGLGNTLRDTHDLEGAIECYRLAIKIDPSSALAYNNLGLALQDKKDVEGAIGCFRQALELNPKDPRGHANLGWMLEKKGELTEAEACFRQALQLDPKDAWAHNALSSIRLRQGRWANARDAAQQGLDQIDPNDAYRPTLERQLAECDKFLAVAPKLSAIYAGEDPSADNAERLLLARACAYSKHHAAAARLYAAAFAAEPAVADDFGAGHRYNAACYAALAGCGQGEDAGKLPASDRAERRAQALAWLRADLAVRKKQLASGALAERNRVAGIMTHWLDDADLNGVRPGPKRIEQPAEERTSWDSFWDEVRSTLEQARKPLGK
jgi:tetratricopeptide (TPR) repeat protein